MHETLVADYRYMKFIESMSET